MTPSTTRGIAVETDFRQGIWLPDDLEERWETMTNLEHREAIQGWRSMTPRMTWQQRRRIRKLLGGPIHDCSVLRYDDHESGRREVKRLIATYGQDGYDEIANRALALYHTNPAVPEERVWRWAESEQRRERGWRN